MVIDTRLLLWKGGHYVSESECCNYGSFKLEKYIASLNSHGTGVQIDSYTDSTPVCHSHSSRIEAEGENLGGSLNQLSGKA